MPIRDTEPAMRIASPAVIGQEVAQANTVIPLRLILVFGRQVYRNIYQGKRMFAMQSARRILGKIGLCDCSFEVGSTKLEAWSAWGHTARPDAGGEPPRQPVLLE